MADTENKVVEAEVKEPKAKKTTKSTKTTSTKKAATKKVEATEEKTPKAKKTTKKATAKEVVEEKTPKASKKAAKVEEVKKPVVTEAKAKALTLKITPRKIRLSCNLVRGKDCDEALAILFNNRHKSAPIVAKVIKSAMANAVNNFNMREDRLYVASIMASDSVKMKRYLPRAKGSASGLVKRYSNLYVVVKERM